MIWIKQGVLWMCLAFAIKYGIALVQGRANSFDSVQIVAWAVVGVVAGLIVWAWDTWVRPVGRPDARK
jgi:hypothetical protein